MRLVLFFTLSHLVFSGNLALLKGEPKPIKEWFLEFKNKRLMGDKQIQALDKQESVRVINTKENMGYMVTFIHASPAEVMNVILRFSDYPKVVPEIAISKPYKPILKQNDRQLIYQYFQVEKSILFIKFTRKNHVIHNTPLKPGEGYITWHTDPEAKEDDFRQVGFYRLTLAKDSKGKELTRLEYYIQLSLQHTEDKLIKSFLIKNGLDGLSWIKNCSENSTKCALKAL